MLPNDSREELEDDIEWLLDSPDQHAFSFEKDYKNLIVPALFYNSEDVVLCGGSNKSWKKVKKFVKDHKKEIIIGIVVVVVVVTVVTVVVVCSASAGAAGAAAAAAGAGANELNSEQEEVVEKAKSEVDKKVTEFKEEVAEEQFSDEDASLEETGRAAGSVLAHETVQTVISSENENLGHDIVDETFSTNSTASDTPTEINLNSQCYQAKGEEALKQGNHEQAIKELNKAIESDPTNSEAYLDRGIAHLVNGELEKSQEDFQTYIEQTPNPTSISDFSKGFAKGLPQGVKESGSEMVHLAKDLVTHPVRTSQQVLEGVSQLKELAQAGEWETLGKTLAPEAHELITDWDNLSSAERGELAGYIFGKYGADIVVPAAAGKAIAKGAKVSGALREARISCEVAEKTLVLESATASTVVVEDVGPKLAGQATKSQAATKPLQYLTPEMQASYEVYDKAEAFLKSHKGYMPEEQARNLINQTGIPIPPKPQGIPDHFKVELSGKGAGIKYVDPNNVHNSIRVMPGKPHSPWSHQQKPYVIQMKDGKTLDKFGNVVSGSSSEAHIPLEEFNYNG